MVTEVMYFLAPAVGADAVPSESCSWCSELREIVCNVSLETLVPQLSMVPFAMVVFVLFG